MEFVALISGTLAGGLWASILVALLHRPGVKDLSPASHLLACFLIAVLTGVAMRAFQENALRASGAAESLSIGMMAGSMRSSWYLPPMRLLRARGRNKAVIGYLLASPVLILAGLLGGYSSIYLKARFI